MRHADFYISFPEEVANDKKMVNEAVQQGIANTRKKAKGFKLMYPKIRMGMAGGDFHESRFTAVVRMTAFKKSRIVKT